MLITILLNILLLFAGELVRGEEDLDEVEDVDELEDVLVLHVAGGQGGRLLGGGGQFNKNGLKIIIFDFQV